MESWYILIQKGISTNDVTTLANMLGMHNLRRTFEYVKIWLANEEQIRTLCRMLDILEVDFILTKDYKLDR